MGRPRERWARLRQMDRERERASRLGRQAAENPLDNFGRPDTSSTRRRTRMTQRATPQYKDHPRESGQKKCPYTQVAFICRFNTMESIPLGTCKMWPL